VRLRGVASGARMSSGRPRFASSKNVAERCERYTEHGTGQIDVVPGAVRFAPSHRREQMQRFGKVSQYHDDQTHSANKLKYRRHSFACNEHNNRVHEQETGTRATNALINVGFIASLFRRMAPRTCRYRLSAAARRMQAAATDRWASR